MIFSVFSLTSASAGLEDTAVLCVEAFTVGGEFILMPSLVEIPAGGTSTVSDLLNDYMGRSEINFGYGAGSTLNNFAVPRTGLLTLNNAISNVLTAGSTGVSNNGWLSVNDFAKDSEWILIVNNKATAEAPDVYRPKNGDIIRIAFSVYGNGADLALSKTNMPAASTVSEPLFPETNRDTLYTLMAKHYAASDFSVDYYIIETAANLNSSQGDINRAEDFLRADINDDFDDIENPGSDIEDNEPGQINPNPGNPTPPSSTPPPTNPPPANSGNPPPQSTPKQTNAVDRIPPANSAESGASLLGAVPLIGVLGVLIFLFRRKK